MGKLTINGDFPGVHVFFLDSNANLGIFHHFAANDRDKENQSSGWSQLESEPNDLKTSQVLPCPQIAKKRISRQMKWTGSVRTLFDCLDIDSADRPGRWAEGRFAIRTFLKVKSPLVSTSRIVPYFLFSSGFISTNSKFDGKFVGHIRPNQSNRSARRNRDAATGKRWSRARFDFERAVCGLCSGLGLAENERISLASRQFIGENDGICEWIFNFCGTCPVFSQTPRWFRTKEEHQSETDHSHSVVIIWMITQMYIYISI